MGCDQNSTTGLPCVILVITSYFMGLCQVEDELGNLSELGDNPDHAKS